MRFTVLGSSGTYPAAGKACSGFLVQEGETALLLDCGPGVFANLQRFASLENLAGVVVTHMHPDHFLDLVPIRYALTYGPRCRTAPLPLYLPPDGQRIWEQTVAAIDESNGAFSAPFAIAEYQEGARLRIGALSARLSLCRHYVPNYGVEVQADGRLVYSGDTGPCQELVSLARDADLFLCEATWLDSEIPPGARGHLTATEAGEIARAARVRQLMLTHILPGVDMDKSVAAARAVFRGGVAVAEEGRTYQVGSADHRPSALPM